jgi:hypothetical protein
MRTTMLAVTAVAAVITAAPVLTGTASADSIRLAQDIRVGPPGVRVEEHRGPAVIEEHRRPGVVIEETEGRRRGDCVTHSESTTHNGTTVTEKERDCAR